MKTSLIVKTYRGVLSRAAMAADDAPVNYAVTYYPAHKAHGSRERNGKIETEWDEPEAVWTRYEIFLPKRGKVAAIRLASTDAVADLERLDAERERLRGLIKKCDEQEKEVLAKAWSDSHDTVSVDEVKRWTEIRRAARAASAPQK